MADGGDDGKWIQKQVLGQGAFGCITLWQNEKTKTNIAIKMCRHKDDLPDKTSDRWRMEVYIMGRLNHDNVIRSVKLPDQLIPRPGELPILAMEYCEGGDLRKVLNRPENCCGLKESEICQLVSGVGSAIEYLHSNRIIHRDLKPENIVLKPIENNRILYKVIDLGYAKELDVNSICNSYVGTMQYLAPELFVSKPYTKTVDYWSFGSLVFECITGYRPFLPSLPPVEWHNAVREKSPDDITATFGEKKEIIFSRKLPQNHQLCKHMKNYFEQWLQLMLRWEPKTRGGGVIQIDGIDRPKCFFLLDKIIDLKMIRILHVEVSNVLSYPVNETHTMQDVFNTLQKVTNIPVEQQYIIHADGTKLESNDPALLGSCNPNFEDLFVFLFQLGPMQVQKKFGKKLPTQVQAIAKEPNTLLPAKEHRKAWAQAVHWFCEINTEYKRLVSAHRAAQLNLMKNITSLMKFKSQVGSEVGKLMACKELFQTSLEFDLKQYQEILQNFPKRQGIFQQWTQMAETISVYNSLRERVELLENKVQSFISEIGELQKKPNTGTELEEFEAESKCLYGQLLQSSQGNGSFDMTEHHKMVDLVSKCFIRRDECTRILYKHLSKILESLEIVQPLLPDFEMALSEIEAASTQLKSMQCRRQADLWKLLAHLSPTAGGAEMSSSVMVTSVMGHCNQSMPTMFDSSFSYGQNLESIKLMDDNRTYTQRLQEILETVVKEQEESLKYFSSLDSSKG